MANDQLPGSADKKWTVIVDGRHVLQPTPDKGEAEGEALRQRHLNEHLEPTKRPTIEVKQILQG